MPISMAITSTLIYNMFGTSIEIESEQEWHVEKQWIETKKEHDNQFATTGHTVEHQQMQEEQNYQHVHKLDDLKSSCQNK